MRLRGERMDNIRKIRLLLSVVLLGIILSGCSSKVTHKDIDNIKIEVIRETVLPGGISYALKLKNDSGEIIIQNNVYVSYPITNAEGTQHKSSNWKVEAKGNQLNIKPGQEVVLNVFMEAEYYKYNNLIDVERPNIEVIGYLNKLDADNQFAMAGSVHIFDENFKSSMNKDTVTVVEVHTIVVDGINISVEEVVNNGVTMLITRHSEEMDINEIDMKKVKEEVDKLYERLKSEE
jgi:hypothetical protein